MTATTAVPARPAPPKAPPAPRAPRTADGPFRCAGEIGPGRFVFLYHRTDPDAPCGYEEAPAYRLHVYGDRPVSCTCPAQSRDPRRPCKHRDALAAQLAPAAFVPLTAAFAEENPHA